MYQVSIIVPVYNASQHLKECIESILKQDFIGYELILIDDGSTDNSDSICDEYASQYGNVKVIHQSNKGVSSARNKGIDAASGRYICFIDSDDWVDPGYLSELYSNMKEYGLSACDLVENDRPQKNEDSITVMDKDTAQVSVYSCFGMQGFPFCKMYDNYLIKVNNIRFNPDIYICEDVLFNIQYLKYIKGKAVWNKKALYHYRKTNAGATKSRFKSHSELHEKNLTEFEAIYRSSKYISSNPAVRNAYMQRAVKAAGTTLRVFEAADNRECKLYNKLLHFVRKNYKVYLFGHEGTMAGKASVLMTCISPTLEYYVWRKMNG